MQSAGIDSVTTLPTPIIDRIPIVALFNIIYCTYKYIIFYDYWFIIISGVIDS